MLNSIFYFLNCRNFQFSVKTQKITPKWINITVYQECEYLMDKESKYPARIQEYFIQVQINLVS